VITRVLFSLAILLLFTPNFLVFGQVVDVERQRMNAKENGLSGAVNLSGSYLDNDKVIYTYTVLSNLQYRTGKNLFFLIGDYKISRSSDTDFQDAAFLHFRYNRALSNHITAEAFTQIQDDKISLLKYRFLAGVGARLTVVDNESFKMNLGIIPMYEFEELLDAASTTHQDFRISQYLNAVLNISEIADFYSTTYFQPIFDQWEDYRLHNESRLEVTLTEKINLNVTNTYSWDANPPSGAPKKRISLKVGFGLDF
tara:strand:- start:5066 stop:5830 length:765 start_codon:yes stop_codon:yes gene_type:complete